MGEAAQIQAELARRLGAARVAVAGLSLEGFRDLVERWAQAQGTSPQVTSALGCRPIACRDLKALGASARAERRVLIVDNTVETHLGCPAVRLGAHACFEPAGEHAVLVGLSRDARETAPGLVDAVDGASAGQDAAWTRAWEGACERARAWRAASDAAQVIASYLRCHPRVAEVRYPGLRSDPSYAVAARTLTNGFGPFVDYRIGGASAFFRIEATPRDPRAQVMALERELATAQAAHGA